MENVVIARLSGGGQGNLSSLQGFIRYRPSHKIKFWLGLVLFKVIKYKLYIE